MRADAIRPEFVDFIPRELEEGVLYVSTKFGTASHLCCCGCRTKIVTPLRETEYSLLNRGGLVSIAPSIGNWNHPCQSHYWITDNRIDWAGKMSPAEIQRGRDYDDALKDAHFRKPALSWWHRLWNWLRRLFGGK